MPLSPVAAQSLSSIALTSPKSYSQSTSSMLSLSPRVAAAAGEEFTDVRVDWQLVVVTVPPGPLGILLDSTIKTAAVLEGFGPVNAEGYKGAVELHGGVLPGSVLVKINHYDLAKDNMTFAEIGQVLRETAHLERELCFQVPVPVAQSVTPPKSVAEEAEWSDEAELVQELAAVSPASVGLHESPTGHIEGSYDQLSDDVQPKSNASRASNASAQSAASSSTTTKKGWKIGGYTLPAMPNMPKNMPSMPKSLPSMPKSLPSVETMKAPFIKLQAAAPSSIAEASTLLFGPNTDADAPVKTVIVEVPTGSLGLNLDGAILDHAVVTGFIPLPDGSLGALEAHGGVLIGSVLIKINDIDVSTATLNEIRSTLGELSGEPRTLVFRLPSAHHAAAVKVVPRAAPVPLVEDLDKRRKLELALVVKYDKASLTRKECWFVIAVHWMNSWVEFAARGGPPPGPIANETLLEPEWLERMESRVPGRPDAPRAGLVRMKDYRCVTPMVWCLFVELHGTTNAPVLARYGTVLYGKQCLKCDVGN